MKHTTLPTLQEFKQEAKSLKKNKSIKTLGEALNTLAKDYGFKNWNIIKTKLIDTSSTINKGTLCINDKIKPTRTLEFVFNNSSVNNPIMEYNVIEESVIIYTSKSLHDAHTAFFNFENNIENNPQLKPFEILIENHKTVNINGISVPDHVFDNEILPYRYRKVSHELYALRNKIKDGTLLIQQFEDADDKIQKLKTLPDEHLFVNALDTMEFCSASHDTLKFNSICQKVLKEHYRLLKLEKN